MLICLVVDEGILGNTLMSGVWDWKLSLNYVEVFCDKIPYLFAKVGIVSSIARRSKAIVPYQIV